jgi:hypothetical protein
MMSIDLEKSERTPFNFQVSSSVFVKPFSAQRRAITMTRRLPVEMLHICICVMDN